MSVNNSMSNVSKRMLSPTIRYLDVTYGPEVTEKILSQLGVTRLFLEDSDGYMSIDTVNELFRIASEVTGEKDFAYSVGRNFIKFGNKAQLFFMGAFATPAMLYKHMEKIESRLVRTTRVQTSCLGRNRFRINVTFVDGFRESWYSCRNRIGSYESIPTLFGLPFAEVKHTQCAFRGDEQCVYDVTVPEIPFLVYRLRILILALLSFGMLLLGVFLNELLLTYAGALGLCTGLAGFISVLRKQVLCLREWSRNSKQALEAQNFNLLRQTEMVHKFHKFSREVNSCNRMETVSKKASELLTKLFGYSGSIVWIVDEKRVMYHGGSFGFEASAEQLLDSTKYLVPVGEKKPDSFIAKVLGSCETLLVNDPEKAMKRFIPITKYLMDRFKPSSLIISPLIQNGKAIGMIMGVFLNGEKVTYQDKLYFESVAPIVSKTLSNARKYEEMQQRIAEREEQIIRRSNELSSAREMVIRSENSSAVGQIAYNIAEKLKSPVDLFGDSFSRTGAAVKKILTDAESNHPNGNDFIEIIKKKHASVLKEALNTIGSAEDKTRMIKNKLDSLNLLINSEYAEGGYLEEIVESVLEIIPFDLKQKAILNIRIQNSLRTAVSRAYLIQILLCLIVNAFESLENKEGKVEIESFDNENGILLNVSDTGQGISEEIESEIMKPFFTTKNKSFHYGLGLTLTREVLNKIGGELTFSSQFGEGTTFSVNIPELAEVQ